MANCDLSGDFQEFRFVYGPFRVPDMLSRKRKKTKLNAIGICRQNCTFFLLLPQSRGNLVCFFYQEEWQMEVVGMIFAGMLKSKMDRDLKGILKCNASERRNLDSFQGTKITYKTSKTIENCRAMISIKIGKGSSSFRWQREDR